jgi:hypothetical protein
MALNYAGDGSASGGDVPKEVANREIAEANADTSSGSGAEIKGDKPTFAALGAARVDIAELTTDAGRLAALASAASSPEARCVLQAKANECSAQAAMLGNLVTMAEAKIQAQGILDSLIGSGNLDWDKAQQFGAGMSPGQIAWLKTEAEIEQKQRSQQGQPATMAS